MYWGPPPILQVLGECRAANDALAEWISKYVFGAAKRRNPRKRCCNSIGLPGRDPEPCKA